MTIRYVGPGGNNSNNGLSWANRKLTLNGVEDTPVAAGDIVYVGPGVYRELLSCDVNGTAGNPIVYIGDVTGEHTDGIGGIVRITGSDADTAATRANCINNSGSDLAYRTFRGFQFDTSTQEQLYFATWSGTYYLDYIIIEDCTFLTNESYTYAAVRLWGGGGAASSRNCTVRRCLFFGNRQTACIHVQNSATGVNTGNIIENCIMIGGANSGGASGILVERVGDVTIRNNLIMGKGRGIYQNVVPATGHRIYIYNNIITDCWEGMNATSVAEAWFTNNYNSLYNNGTNYNNCSAGADSLTYPGLTNLPILLDGFMFPWNIGKLSKWSQLRRHTGTSEATDDFYGITRSATSGKKSWGAVQDTGAVRETGTTHLSSPASILLPDAGEQFIMRVPVTNISTTVSIYCYRQADYTGTNPTMIIRQPGQSDITVTDTGSASAWNQLTYTLTPAASPPYIDILIVSYNTATVATGNELVKVFFDTFRVS